MQVKEIRIPYKSRRDVFRLYPIGDIHAGVVHCAEKKIKEMVKQISSEENSLWIGMGDYADCITPQDPRWDIEVISDWIENSNIAESQRRWIVELFKPIKDKCIGLLTGNHEESIRLHNCQDIQLDICRDLGVPNLGYSCFIKFVFVRLGAHTDIFTGHFEHGSGAAQTEGGKMMRLKKAIDSFEANIYGIGHLHDIKTLVSPKLYLDNALNIKEFSRVGAITGSWFRSYTEGVRPSYAEKKSYYPTTLGCPVFIIHPDKQIIRIEE